MYCVYLTIYDGSKLPPYYIGSCKTRKIFEENYTGSVYSRKFSKIYREEKKNNPHLFDVLILEEFETSKESLEYELKLQRELDVVKSDKFFNMSLAQPKGFFGMDNSGKLNPMFGRTPEESPNYGSKWLNNGIEEKRIFKYDIQSFLDNGWTPGRISVKGSNNFARKNKRIKINNGEKTKNVSLINLEKWKKDGWVEGPLRKNIFVHKDEVNIEIFDDEYKKYIENGYKRGKVGKCNVCNAVTTMSHLERNHNENCKKGRI